MKLNKKKELAARTLNVGKNRILFNLNRLDEIKEAITKQDIRDLYKNGAIKIKDIMGRRKIIRRKTRRRVGSRKLVVGKKKQTYVILTRKLRNYLASLKMQGAVSKENIIKLRREIRASIFKSLAQMKEKIKELK